MRSQLADDPYYRFCAREGLLGHECAGRITWEHAIYQGGKQVQQRWAIIPLCAKAHNVDEWQDCGDLDKEVNVWLALNRATQEELLAVSKAMDYFRYRGFLNEKYGRYLAPALEPLSIAY